jgi:hypothetical protein
VCPIFGIGSKNVTSIGVLLVFKGGRGGFTPEDLNSVMAASDLLGVCVSRPDDGPLNFETVRINCGPQEHQQ